MRRNNSRNLSVLFAVIFIFSIVLGAVLSSTSCSKHPNPPSNNAMDVDETLTRLNVSNPYNSRSTAYWANADKENIKDPPGNGILFTCSHGVPVFYLKHSGEFEIVPNTMGSAWKYCKEESIK